MIRVSESVARKTFENEPWMVEKMNRDEVEDLIIFLSEDI